MRSWLDGVAQKRFEKQRRVVSEIQLQALNYHVVSHDRLVKQPLPPRLKMT
jgi:hypothetical protein